MGKPKTTLGATDYLLLEAVGRRSGGMTVREVSHAAQVTVATVRKRLELFVEQGVVLKVGARYYTRLVLWVAPLVDIVEATTGERVVVQTPKIPELVPRVHQNAPEAPQEAPEAPQMRVPDIHIPEPPPAPYKPPTPHMGVSASARKLAVKMNIPSAMDGWGELSMGRVAECYMCKKKTTPFRYGETVVCPMCSRGGK